jgi:hypothetical protein
MALVSTVAWLMPAAPADAQISSKSTTHATIRCESRGPESTCPIDTSRGVRLVREFSRNRCFENRTWGWDPFRIWVRDGCQAEFEIGGRGQGGGSAGREIVCESNSNRMHRCEADTRGGVELVRQISNSRCTFNRTWGYDRRSIWVSDGCRARFRLGSGGSGWPGGGGSGGSSSTERITCESIRDRHQTCPARGRITSARLTRQLSGNACTEGRSWGWNDRSLWVSRGCRGEFEVRSR